MSSEDRNTDRPELQLREAGIERGIGSGNGDGPRDGDGPAKPNRHVTKNYDTVFKVVQATFIQGDRICFRSFRDVARELGLSVPAVRWALECAFETGVVFPLISPEEPGTDVLLLEQRVKQLYPWLSEVLLVPGFPAMVQDISREHQLSLHKQVVKAMACRLASHLDTIVASYSNNPNGVLIGCAWGKTLHALAEHLNRTSRNVFLPTLHAVPIIGPTDVRRTKPVEANIIAMDIARPYGGTSAQLPCPAFLHMLGADSIIDSLPLRSILRELWRCDLVITGMGPILDGGEDSGEITLTNDPELNRKLIGDARKAGAIGECCSWFFDAEGQPVETDHMCVGLGYEGLRHIAADRKRRVILITGGDKRRFKPLKVALKARLASVLVTDTVTARYLVGEG